MNYTFCQCQDKQYKWVWWALRISNSFEIVDYILNHKSERLIRKYFHAKTADSFEGKTRDGEHLTTEEFAIIMTLKAKSGRKSVVDDILCIHDKFLKPMYDFVGRGEILLINPAGGYRFLDKTVKVLTEVVKEKFMFPEYTKEDIRISKWEGGKHYYARIGQIDVVDNDARCWNTEEEAHKVAVKFLNQWAKK